MIRRLIIHCPGSLRDGWEPEPMSARCEWCCQRMLTDDRGLIPSHDTTADDEENDR